MSPSSNLPDVAETVSVVASPRFSRYPELLDNIDASYTL